MSQAGKACCRRTALQVSGEHLLLPRETLSLQQLQIMLNKSSSNYGFICENQDIQL